MVRPRATVQARRLAEARRLVAARFGPHVLRRLSAARSDPDARAVSSGSLGVDLATGLGGLPRGQVTELFGTATSGKTSLLYAALAAGQRRGGIVALLDAEGSADAETLLGCGIDLDDLIVAQPTSAADALLVCTILARCGGLDLLALNSVAALRDLALPSGELYPERQSLDLARLLARALRVMIAALRDSPTAFVLTNELLPYPPAHRSVGGLALRHFAALRLAIEPLARLPDVAGGTGALRVGVTVIKHKLGAPCGYAEVDLVVGRGLDWAAELLALGLATGVIERHPLGLLLGADLLGRGPEAARRWLATDAALAETLTAAIIAAHGRHTAA